MSPWHLAQMNMARARYPLEDPRMAGFMSRLDEINALADRHPGFLWRLQSEWGNATDISATDDPRLIINMSVWESVEALSAFVYRSDHRLVMARRKHWFERPSGAFQVLWWIEAGHLPTVDEGLRRLGQLERSGPGGTAFTFKCRHAPPETSEPSRDMKPEPFCIGWS